MESSSSLSPFRHSGRMRSAQAGKSPGILTMLGHTILVIEHNLDVIRQADWVIDLGPEGGDAGGEIIAEGTPEQIAAVDSSYTGRFLKGRLETPA